MTSATSTAKKLTFAVDVLTSSIDDTEEDDIDKIVEGDNSDVDFCITALVSVGTALTSSPIEDDASTIIIQTNDKK